MGIEPTYYETRTSHFRHHRQLDHVSIFIPSREENTLALETVHLQHVPVQARLILYRFPLYTVQIEITSLRRHPSISRIAPELPSSLNGENRIMASFYAGMDLPFAAGHLVAPSSSPGSSGWWDGNCYLVCLPLSGATDRSGPRPPTRSVYRSRINPGPS